MVSPGRILWLLRRDLARGPVASYHFWRTLPKVPAQLRTWSELPASDIPIHTLSGAEQFPLLLWMLASLSHFTGMRWRVVVHDDGSLTEEHRQLLADSLPESRLVSKAEADRAMEPLLRSHSACRAYRDSHPLAKKCFDVPTFLESDRFLLLDSDVLFFAEPTELLRWCGESNDGTCWFNEDPQEPSPVSPAKAESVFGSPLWPRVNSGLCFLQRDAISDFDFFEQCLEPKELEGADPWRLEQMLLALGASRAGKGGLLPSNYEVSLGRSRNPKSVARHYVGAVRDRFYGEGLAELVRVVG